MTRDDIVNQIAHRLKRPDDEDLKLVLSDIVLSYFNTMLRRSIARNGIDQRLILPFYTNLIIVNKDTHLIDETKGTTNTIHRSLLKIPTPLRFNTDTPYIKVTDSTNKVYPFKPIYHNTKSYRTNLPYIDATIPEYTVINDFIFFSSKLTTTEIIVYQVYENPDESIDNYYKRLGYAFDDNTAFPYPTDLVSDITNLILKGEINPDNV